MSRFYGTVNSSSYQTVASRRGHQDIAAHIRGWDNGVKIYGMKSDQTSGDNGDEFQIYLTSGSSDSRRDLFLGTVVVENNETRFIPGAHIDEITTK